MTAKLKYSDLPGAYERQLQRKQDNPLFPAEQQQPGQEDLEQARIRDQQDMQAFMENFQETLKQAAGLLGSVESDVVLDLKQRLEQLYVNSASLSHDMEQIHTALLKLLDVCMMTIRKGAVDDPVALKKLDEEEQARQIYFELLETPLVADLLRADDVITESDLIPCMLSESEQGLKAVMDLFEPEQLHALLEPMKNFVNQLSDHAKNSTDAEIRLEQFESTVKKITN